MNLIPQGRTRVYEFLQEPSHNSTWDTTMGPDGRLYMSLSSELKDMGYARLYEYDYKTNCGRKLLDVEDLIVPRPRALRPSKFHTSISVMNDGKLAMTTHSTDKGISHPTWMPHAFFGNSWEGFSGSQVIVYDPGTGKAEIFGTPAPNESLYTSCYDRKHNAYWSLGYLKGHLYRFDFNTRKVKDFGKVTENGSYRICPGADGNLYSASKSGWMFKIDTDAEKVIDMNYRVPMVPAEKDYFSIGNFSKGCIGPDNRLYVCIMHGPDMIAIDTEKETVENIGPYIPEEKFAWDQCTHSIFGMAFDAKGRLWYAVDSFCDAGVPGSPDGLYCWDITRGGKPEYKGIIGVPGRISACVSELYIHDGHLLMVDQNHGVAPTAVFVADIDEIDSAAGAVVHIDPEAQSDTMYHAADEERFGYNKPFNENGAIIAANPFTFDGDLAEYYRLWRMLAPDHIEDSRVKGMVWHGDSLTGICGKDEDYVFTIEDGRAAIVAASKYPGLETLKREITQLIPETKKLPAYPGRQFRAKATAAADLSGGRKLVGTEDGLLALISDGKVWSLGMCGYNGPVRSISACPDGGRAYGTAGDDEDLGMVFTYSDAAGLELKGMIQRHDMHLDGAVASNVLSACAVSPDGKKLAVGSADRMGMIYIYNI